MLIEQEALEIVRAGKKAVLAVILHTEGSTPRDTGAMMIVNPDKSIIGTIGGGPMEYAVVCESAQQTQGPEKTVCVTYGMKGKDVERSVSICGGSVRVCMHSLTKKDEEGLTEICRKMKAFEDFSFVIEKDGAECAVIKCGEKGIAADEEKGIIFAGEPKVNERLILFGGGHVSLATAQIAQIAGFDIVVVDDRPEFANPERFKGAQCIVVDSYENIPITDVRDTDYVVIATTGHKGDRYALSWAVNTKACYIGMLGSASKTQLVYEKLLSQGVPKERLSQVHSPAGLPLGGRTPGDIGVSIVAQMVEYRADHAKGEVALHKSKIKA